MYSRKLLREKTFANFEVLWLFAKVFFAKFGGVASIVAQVNNSQRFSPWKLYFPPIFESFSLKSFALYGMTLNVLLSVKYLFVLACSMLQQNYWRFLCKFSWYHGLNICTEVYPAVWMLLVHFIHWHAICNKVQVK